jgi:hypothetical protein
MAGCVASSTRAPRASSSRSIAPLIST